MIKFLQLPTCSLAEFVSSSATSFDVSGFLYNDGVTAVDPADIGDVCYATLEPKTVREELISFTIDSVTSEGVATITAVRGLSQKSPYGTGGASFDHQNGSDFVISNNPGLFNHLAAKDNEETITEQWSFPDPTVDGAPVTKSYYEDTLDSGLVHTTGDESIAGEKTFTGAVNVEDAVEDTEPLTKGQSDTIEATNVKLTGDQTIAGEKTFSTSPKVPDATAADEPYTKGQHDADAEAASAVASPTVRGSAKLDTAADNVLDPEVLTATADRVAALEGGGDFGDPDADNKFVTEDFLDTRIAKRTVYDLADSPATWTKPDGLKFIKVEIWGGGGNGAGGSVPSRNSGGGGGGYNVSYFNESELGATETITVGGAATNSTFGSLLTGYRGGNGKTSGSNSTYGGGGGGQLGEGTNGGTTNYCPGGSPGYPSSGYGSRANPTLPYLPVMNGTFGGGGGASDSGNPGGNSIYGGGGGGGEVASGGVSAYGGNGGAGNGAGAGFPGSVPGGGGGAGSSSGGAGGAGRVIVTEYYS